MNGKGDKSEYGWKGLFVLREDSAQTLPHLSLMMISFSIGFFALIAQISFFREILVVFYGNELCIGMVFSFWLAGIFFGAFMASFGKAADHKLFWRTGLLLMILILVTPVQLCLVRLSRFLFSTPPGEYIPFWHMTMICFFFVFPISLLVGALFPIVGKLFSAEEDLKATAVSTLYIWESVGSLLGGLLFTFFLIPYLDIFAILFLSSLIPLISMIFLSHSCKSRSVSSWLMRISVFLFIGLSLSLLMKVPEKIQHWTSARRWISFVGDIEKISEKDSKYQNIAIGKQAKLYSIYLNGQYDNSFPDPYQSALTAHLVMSQHPHPETILIVGGGFAGIIEEVLRYPIKRVDYVELDPALIPMTFHYLPEKSAQALSDQRLHIHYIDGRYYIKFCPRQYDIILLNSIDPSTAVSNRYYTVEFFYEVKRKLKAGGLFVTSLSSSENYFGSDMIGYVASVYHSMRSAFKYVVISPTERAYFFASNSEGTATSDIETLQQRFRMRRISTPFFSELAFQLLFPPERVQFVKSSLEAFPHKEMNADIRPVTYFYSLKLWARFSGSRIQRLLEFLESHGKIIWFSLLATLLSIFVMQILPRKPDQRSRIRAFLTLCIGSTGFGGMAWSLILIFSFQNIMGYLYSEIGILVALFMFGLSIGGWAMQSLYKKAREGILIIIADSSTFFYSFLLFFLLHLLYSMELKSSFLIKAFFSLLMFLSGFLTGFEFPVSIRLFLSASGDIRKAAGFIDASDHMGASFGALLTGVLLIPLGGLWVSVLAIGSLKFLSLLILIATLLWGRVKLH